MSEGERLLPYIWQGDMYEVYHRDGEITRIYVAYDNMNVAATEVDFDDLPPELQQKLSDRLHLNK